MHLACYLRYNRFNVGLLPIPLPFLDIQGLAPLVVLSPSFQFSPSE